MFRFSSSGYQTLMNPKESPVPCNSHFFKPCDVLADDIDTNSVTFFGTMKMLLIYFRSFAYVWFLLKEHVPIHTKLSRDTRQSSKHESIRVIAYYNTDTISEALDVLRDEPDVTSAIKSYAKIVLICITIYSLILGLHF